jgi:hypothetical protein
MVRSRHALSPATGVTAPALTHRRCMPWYAWKMARIETFLLLLAGACSTEPPGVPPVGSDAAPDGLSPAELAALCAPCEPCDPQGSLCHGLCRPEQADCECYYPTYYIDAGIPSLRPHDAIKCAFVVGGPGGLGDPSQVLDLWCCNP